MVAKAPKGGGASKIVPKLKTKIYKLEQEVKSLKANPPEVIREVPVEVIKEVKVIERVEVPVEVIKEVPYEVIKEVPKEVIREVIKRVEIPVPYETIKEIKIPFEVIKEVPTEVIKEVLVNVPYEVIKEVPVDREVKVFVPTEDLEAKKRWHEELDELKKVCEEKVVAEGNAKKALEERYQAAIGLMKALSDQKISMLENYVGSGYKKYKRLATYAYILTPYVLSQILWMLT